MRRLAAIAWLVAVTGCDVVFGLSGGGGDDGADGAPPAADAPVDATPSCFVDDFDDGVLDVGVWEPFGTTGAPDISETGGDFVVTLPPTALAYYGQSSLRQFALKQEDDGLVV